MTENTLTVQVLGRSGKQLDLAKLEDVLKRKLIIPSYQRPYAWEEEDIEEIFQTIGNTEEDICFFGSIILSQKDYGPGQETYYIIDGQQRLSSFLLILRVYLDQLEKFIKKSAQQDNQSKKQIQLEGQLKQKKRNLSNIINTVALKREGFEVEAEQSIINFINSGNSHGLSTHLKKKIKIINNNLELENTSTFIKKLDFILNKIKFCLIYIAGPNSENFAINLFNTLNTTGLPLTAFEVLKSELHTIKQPLSERLGKVQSKVIDIFHSKNNVTYRQKVVTHTGKLLLYLPLYRGDFNKNNSLSDKKFKDQRAYLKEVLNNKSADQLVKDIEIINDFYSDYWLKPDSIKSLLKKDDAQVCFQFLSELKHDRVLPILLRFYKNKKESLRQCVKMCTAFSVLWRAFHNGGTDGIDGAYKDISLSVSANDCKIGALNKDLKKLFFKKLKTDPFNKLKNNWITTLTKSSVYNKKLSKLSKFLLFTAYNQRAFNPATQTLETGKGVDIFNIHYWKHKDYKTIEHIIPQADDSNREYIHTLGNLTLLPQCLNASLGDKLFAKKLVQYTQFCSNEAVDQYPYLPIIKHIAHYKHFQTEQIKQRSKILAEFIWQTLAEDWLGWKA